MRKIGTLKDPHQGIAFGRLLNKNEIKNQIEVIRIDDPIDQNKQRYECVVWIYDEDQIEKAEFLLDQFHLEEHDYLNENYTLPKETKKTKLIKKYPISLFFIIICVAVFLISELTSPVIHRKIENPLVFVPLSVSPIEKALFYDWPEVFHQVDKVIEQYGALGVESFETLPEEGKKELVKATHTPVWYGIYPYLLNKYGKHPEAYPIEEGALFYSIRHGEIWRLVTPIFLHYDLFHIFFNMIWLLYLGQMLEQVLNKKQYLLLILISAIISNTFQYLMTGPNFMGYSGVLTAYFGFIWMRQKVAPWEAYPLHPSIITFIAIFILGMFFLSFISFFTEIFYNFSFSPGIANTAHVVGGLVGICLARLPYFAKK